MKPDSTHFKLFLDHGSPMAALFCGTDESKHWQKNVLASEILASGWEELPKECLISIDSARDKGFLTTTFHASTIDNQSVIFSWSMRAARLAALKSERESNQNDNISNGRSCRDVVCFLEKAARNTRNQDHLNDISRQRIAWILRGVDAYVKAWELDSVPQNAESLLELFFSLLDNSWKCELNVREMAIHNYNFWLKSAINSWMNLSRKAETNGDYNTAVLAASSVLRLIEFAEVNQVH